jgi:hypothetical protein
MTTPDRLVATPPPQATPDTPREPKADNHKQGPYTAVLYFHGMGSQRRYEELSRLVDCLDGYAYACLSSTPSGDRLVDIEARLEAPRGDLKREVAYIRVVHSFKENGQQQSKRYRFYETYWAPIASDAVTVNEVILWLFGKVTTPLKALFTNWRLRSRLRRSALVCMWAKRGGPGKNCPWDDAFHALLKLYDCFESPTARREHPKGSFLDFLTYIWRQPELARNKRILLVILSLAWGWTYLMREIWNGIQILTVLLALGLGLGAAVWLAVMLLSWIEQSGYLSFPFIGTTEWQLLSWQNIGLLAGAVLGLFGVTRFFRNYLGDVLLWTTYEETDAKNAKRAEILTAGLNMLTHILKDPLCERVAIVGHSLGTTVALDTLLQAAKHNRAKDSQGNPMDSELRLSKIEHFFTLASPIDKVYYFFESYSGSYHRYNRVVEDLRGDIGTIPFAKNGKPHIHWINFWDLADIISGSLETPTNRKLFRLQVDNHRVASYLFPNPAASHTAYFCHLNVLEYMFAAIFKRRYSFVNAPRVEDRPDYDAAKLPAPDLPAFVHWCQRVMLVVMLLLPWALLLALIMTVIPHTTETEEWVKGSAIGAILILLAGWTVSSLLGHLRPQPVAKSGKSSATPPSQDATDRILEPDASAS